MFKFGRHHVEARYASRHATPLWLLGHSRITAVCYSDIYMWRTSRHKGLYMGV